MKSLGRSRLVLSLFVGVAVVLSLPSFPPLPTPAYALPASPAAEQTGFTFATVMAATGAHRMLFTGDGKINPVEVEANGSFTHFLAGIKPDGTPGGPPFKIVAAGTWKAKKLVSLDLIGNYGAHTAGVAIIDVDLVREFPSRAIIPAKLRVVCNIGAGGLDTTLPEGTKLFDLPGGLTFNTIAGVAFFTNEVEESR